jgi:peptidylprolyl isomerase
MRTKLATLALALALGAGLAACGDDDDETEAAATPAPTETATPEPADVSALAREVSKNTKRKPSIPAPSGEPPAELVTEDIVAGKGRGAKAGDTLTMQYVGISWSNGQEFDASWNSGQKFPFQLGAGMVIPGWDQGMEGMKKGGRRLLAIPPDLAYGPEGSPPVIGPNETLVFVVDLVKIG